jgi:glucosamine--fructose-6-phosphate aminotransferase (isomerizing)
VVGLGDDEMFVASDVPALVPYTSSVVYLEDGDVARLSWGEVEIRNAGRPVYRQVHQVEWSKDQIDRGGFEHFMLKEMHEQPNALRDTLDAHARVALNIPDISKVSRLLLMGCGTSYHACLVAKEVFAARLPFPVDVVVASEYRPVGETPAGAVAVALSQSGETADTLTALQSAKKAGFHTVAITNVVNSSVTRTADDVLYTKAGPEMAVAATKTFIAQLAALYRLGASLAAGASAVHGQAFPDLAALPAHVRSVLGVSALIEQVGRRFADYDNLFLIGRGVEMPVALEGALKFKEVAYVHAEGCYAGELKHGPFALLGPTVPVIALVGRDEHRVRMLTSMREIKARGAFVVAVAPQGDEAVQAVADHVISVQDVDGDLLPFVHTVVLQLLAYYCALERGCPIDRPRNLAKSVTVL